MNTTPTHDVLVVGAGPSGLVTAIAAARAGARVLLVDRHPRTSIFPKATGLRPRTMELMRAWGLEEQVRAGAQDRKAAIAVSSSFTGPVLEEVPIAAVSPEVLDRVSPAGFALAPQDHLEPVLLEHLRGLGGEVRFGVTVLDLRQRDDDVAVQVRTEAGEETLAVRWVVGADGAGSTVRDVVGLGVRHLGQEGEHVATLFRADLDAHLVDEDRYGLYFVLSDKGDQVFAPSGIDGRWVFDRDFHPERGETVTEWEPRAVEEIRAAAGVPDLDIEVLGIFPWSFGAAVATGIDAGRVFLVGDAAHRTTPRGATGMNTGIADGHNLGWKLGWVSLGLADESLLSSYAEERYPVGLHNALRSLEEFAPEARRDLSHDFGVVYDSSAVQTGDEPPETESGAVVSATPGARAPHVWVTYDGRRLSTIDLFEGRLTLLTHDGERWRPAAADRSGLPLTLLVVGGDVADPSDELAHRYRLHAHGAVLVRPDGIVAARLLGEDPERELAEALATALGRATVTTS